MLRRTVSPFVQIVSAKSIDTLPPSRFIIVGAGSAGCVLARRLAEVYPESRITLLESGPDTTKSPLVRVPAAVGFIIPYSKRYKWAFDSTPQEGLLGRTLFQPRGRGLGGSSAVNAMVHLEGVAEDYDGWGFDAWGWDKHVRRILRGHPHPVHPGAAPPSAPSPKGLRLPHTPPLDYTKFPASRAMVDSARKLLRDNPYGFNPPSGRAAEQLGVGGLSLTRCGGTRADAFMSHIAPLDPEKFACRFGGLVGKLGVPVRTDPPAGTNLTVVTDAHCEKIDIAMPRPVGQRVRVGSDGVSMAEVLKKEAGGGTGSGGAESGGGAAPSAGGSGIGSGGGAAAVGEAAASQDTSLAVAVGVQLAGGVYLPLEHDGEVIVSSGAFQSPQLLMVSGIGDAVNLQRVRVPTYVHSPNVGQNLQDHLNITANFATSGLDTHGLTPASLLRLAKDARNWVGAGKASVSPTSSSSASASADSATGGADGGVATEDAAERHDILEGARKGFVMGGLLTSGAFADVGPGGRITGGGRKDARHSASGDVDTPADSEEGKRGGGVADPYGVEASTHTDACDEVYGEDAAWTTDVAGGDRLTAGERAAAMARGPPGLERRVQLHFVPLPCKNHLRDIVLGEGVSMYACQLQPRSIGSVSIASSDPSAPPVINPRYLLDDEKFDLEVMMDGAALLRAIARESPLSKYIRRGHDGILEADTRAKLEAFVRKKAETVYHPVGTCAMGPLEAGGVVEAGTLRVHGVANLRVADASVMPRITSGNTNVPSQMIGHRAAELIVGRCL